MGLLLLGRTMLAPRPVVTAPDAASTAGPATSLGPETDPTAGQVAAGTGVPSPGTPEPSKRQQIFPRAPGLKLPPYRLANVEPIEPHPRPGVGPATRPPLRPSRRSTRRSATRSWPIWPRTTPRPSPWPGRCKPKVRCEPGASSASSACAIKDTKLAREAYQKLDGPARLYVVLLCQRNKIGEADLSGSKPWSSSDPQPLRAAAGGALGTIEDAAHVGDHLVLLRAPDHEGGMLPPGSL